MNPISHGQWRIQSVDVNSQPVTPTEDFTVLVSNQDGIQIEPAGISFQVNQATARSAVLESRSQIFFADFFVRGERLTLKLSRPCFSETVSVVAVFDSAQTANSA